MQMRTSLVILSLLAVLSLASCAVVDSPTSVSSGSGVPLGATISVYDAGEDANENNRRIRKALIAELDRAGYRLTDSGEYRIEFGFAKRPAQIGILLGNEDGAKPEAGSWRSRPVERDLITLCDASIYRLMLAVTHEPSGTIRYRGSSDDDICGEPNDQKLKALVAVALGGIKIR